MERREVKNAKISSTMLGIEDHGICYYMIHLNYTGGGGSGQGFGGYALDSPVTDPQGKFLKREGVAYGAETILQILKVLGIDSWEKLPGTPCRVEGNFKKIHRIGNFLKDQWFNPETLGKETS